MYSYNAWQWIMFFSIYCLIGWAGESLYVSAEHKKWVNRGFLHGPFLPIYGSGAIIILFATLPVRNNPILVFVLGMASATVLEYFTGFVMEKIFKVRYWDYTEQPYNLNGYICLGCSIAWGVASELLIMFIHKPVEKLVLGMNDLAVFVGAVVFLVYFCLDLTASAKEAFDLRKIIIDAIESNEKLKRIERRMDIVIAFAEDDRKKFVARIEKLKDEGERRRMFMAFDIAEAKLELYEKLQDKKQEYMEEIQKSRAEIEDIRRKYTEKVKRWRRKSARRILKRNPSANANKNGFDISDIDDDESI